MLKGFIDLEPCVSCRTVLYTDGSYLYIGESTCLKDLDGCTGVPGDAKKENKNSIDLVLGFPQGGKPTS